MKKVSLNFILPLIALFLLCLHDSQCSSMGRREGSSLLEVERNILAPDIYPRMEPPPFLPLLAPSPLMPFTDNGMPKLSGRCTLDFSAAESVLSKTAIDCWASFAPYLANVVCCPQFEASLVILIGQSSKYSGELALNQTHAEYCLSDIEQILQAQGSAEKLQNMCSINSSNLTQASCPVIYVNEIDSLVDSSRLLASCKKIDAVNECCNQVCQNAVLDAARNISTKNYGNSSSHWAHVLPETLSVVEDCKTIVLRWLASKLDPSSMNTVVRVLASCNTNRDCPLVLPNTKNVTTVCGNVISNQTTCCNAVESYVSHLQEQSLVTNLQALNCAASLGIRLQKANVSHDLYNLCQIKLKDFSLQVASQDSGCLLPSLPLDATYDKKYGISFICDLNDNVEAPWPATTYLPTSSCNTTIAVPALPIATSAQSRLGVKKSMFFLLIVPHIASLGLLAIICFF